VKPWFAPELLHEYAKPASERNVVALTNEQTDVWSYGCFLYETLFGENPFEHAKDFNDLTLQTGKFEEISKTHFDKANYPKKLRDLVTACLVKGKKRPSFDQIASAFDSIIIEYSIADENGKKLWKTFFPTKHTAVFEELLTAMEKITESSFSLFTKRFLKVLLEVHFPKDSLSISRFGWFLHWFPLKKSFEGDLSSLCQHDWYFGSMSSEAATGAVGNKPSQFIVRFSSSQVGSYTITDSPSKHGEKPRHFPTTKTADGGFSVGSGESQITGKNLEELIHTYMKKFKHTPCPGSPFKVEIAAPVTEGIFFGAKLAYEDTDDVQRKLEEAKKGIIGKLFDRISRK